MKKLILPVIIGAILTLAGCSAKPDTKALNQPLTTAINQHQYAKAAGINAAIIKLKPTASAKRRATQLTALTKAEAAWAANHFKQAQRQAAKVTTGHKTLTVAAKRLATKAATARRTQSRLDQQLQTITRLATSDKAKASTQLQMLLADKALQQPQFQAEYIKALKLQNTLGEATGADSATTAATSAPAKADQATASATSASQSSSASSASTQSSTASAVPEGQPVADTTDISDADLDRARDDIKAAGEDPTYFSGNDLRQAILKARAAGRTHLQASDWQ